MADLLNTSVQPVIPVGTIIEACGPPDSTWLACDGSILAQSSYPAYVNTDNVELHPRKWHTWDYVDVAQGVTTESTKNALSVMGSTIVVVGSGARTWYSTDSGANWTAHSPSVGTGTHYFIVNNGTNFVRAVSGTTAYYSSDGSTWTSATLPNTGNWYYAIYALGKFLLVSNSLGINGKYMYSTTGTSWTAGNIPYASGYCKGIAADDTYFYWLGTDNSTWWKIYRSSDGINWSAGTDDFLLNMQGIWSYEYLGMHCMNNKVVLTVADVPDYFVCEGSDPRDPSHYIRNSGQPFSHVGDLNFRRMTYADSRYFFLNWATDDAMLVGKDINDLTATRTTLQDCRDIGFKSDGSVGVAIPGGFSTSGWRSMARCTGVPYNSSTHFQLPFVSMAEEPRILNYIKVAE